MSDEAAQRIAAKGYHQCARCARTCDRVWVAKAGMGWLVSVQCHGERRVAFVSRSMAEDRTRLIHFAEPEPPRDVYARIDRHGRTPTTPQQGAIK